MPAAWGVAIGMLGDEHFADDAVISALQDDSVLCSKHYRYVCRAIGHAVAQPDAPT